LRTTAFRRRKENLKSTADTEVSSVQELVVGIKLIYGCKFDESQADCRVEESLGSDNLSETSLLRTGIPCTAVMGLKVVTDQPFTDKQRWIELLIPGAETGDSSGVFCLTRVDSRTNCGFSAPTLCSIPTRASNPCNDLALKTAAFGVATTV
jgi:hypothetical protein